MGSYSGLFKMHHYLSVEILIFRLLFFMLVSAYSALKLLSSVPSTLILA